MKRIATFVSVAFFLLLLAPPAQAGFIVRDGQVTMVSNTSSNQPRFHVRIGGGTGVCADSVLIFYEENAGDRDIFKRGFTLALTALVTGSLCMSGPMDLKIAGALPAFGSWNRTARTGGHSEKSH